MATFEIDGKMTVEELIKLLAPKLTPDLFTTPLPQEDMIEVEFTDKTTFYDLRIAVSRMFDTTTFIPMSNIWHQGKYCSLSKENPGPSIEEFASSYAGKTGTLVVTKDMTVKDFKSRVLQKFGVGLPPAHWVGSDIKYWPDKRTLESIGLLDPFKIVKK